MGFVTRHIWIIVGRYDCVFPVLFAGMGDLPVILEVLRGASNHYLNSKSVAIYLC